MLVRGTGIRDISEIEGVSTGKALSVLVKSEKVIKPKKRHYENIEVDEFWTYVGKKQEKVWLIYAYERRSGEIVAYVWGKRDLKTAKKLKARLKELSVSYDTISTDNWDSFVTTFKEEKHFIGKKYTVGIEGNNCRLRHRIRRAFCKTCCFSKKLFNHLKAFDLVLFYINYGYV
jgi:IS1 family transposase